MRRLLVPVATLLLTVGCQAPRGLPSPRVLPFAPGINFQLTQLQGETIAVCPIATADLDESAAGTVLAEYSDQGKFLEAMSLKISIQLLGIAKSTSIGCDKVRAALAQDEVGRAILDPVTILGTRDPRSRLVHPQLTIAQLSRRPVFFGVRFIFLPRDIAIRRQGGQSGPQGVPPPAHPGDRAGNAGGSAAGTTAELRFAILDLASKTVVWDGSVFASVSSVSLKATLLHRMEDGLVGSLLGQVQGL